MRLEFGNRESIEVLKAFGNLTPMPRQVLIWLARKQPATASDLAIELKRKPGVVRRHLRRLSDLNLARAFDKREKEDLFELTDRARAGLGSKEHAGWAV